MLARRWFVGPAMMCACLSGQRPVALYDGRVPPDEVALLVGDVRDVDGKFVSERGGAFELLPGCHVVGVVESWGTVEPDGAVVAKIPRVVFALPMREAHRYVVTVDAKMHGAPTGTLHVLAREEDAEGNVTREFSPASAREIAECQPLA